MPTRDDGKIHGKIHGVERFTHLSVGSGKNLLSGLSIDATWLLDT